MSEVYVTCTTAGSTNERIIAWTSLKGRKSLDEICSSLELVVPVTERVNIHKHDKLRVMFKDKYLTDNGSKRPVLTVLVDEIDDDTDRESKDITIIGRSKARDIIDSKWTGAISGTPDLLMVAQSIANKFDIQVLHMPTNRNGTKAVTSFSWENESPWAKLLAECDAQGYILTSAQDGNLYLWRPATGINGYGFAITEGINVERVRSSENGSEQFHTYVVNGNSKTATVVDKTCKNSRILTINLTDFSYDQEKLNRRARTEMLRRQQNKTTVTVSGWGLSDMQIQKLGSTYQKEVFWETNLLIPVKLPSSGIDGKMLISQVEYIADAKTYSCDVTLVNPEGYR